MKSNTNMLLENLNAKRQGQIIFQLSIMKKISAFLDETIHIMFACVVHLRGHRNKVAPSWNPLYLQILAMALNFTTAHVGWLITFTTIVFHVRSITTTSAINIWSSQVMWRLVSNETFDVRAYHHSFHSSTYTTCSLFRVKHTWRF